MKLNAILELFNTKLNHNICKECGNFAQHYNIRTFWTKRFAKPDKSSNFANSTTFFWNFFITLIYRVDFVFYWYVSYSRVYRWWWSLNCCAPAILWCSIGRCLLLINEWQSYGAVRELLLCVLLLLFLLHGPKPFERFGWYIVPPTVLQIISFWAESCRCRQSLPIDENFAWEVFFLRQKSNIYSFSK